ncbi:MAG: DUF2905 domain-containing protein [Candidatus Brocadiales bacterium]
MEFSNYGRLFVFVGLFFLLLGASLLVGGKVPFIGRLPGDILLEKKNFTLYFPFATCALFSIMLSVFFWLFSGFFKR